VLYRKCKVQKINLTSFLFLFFFFLRPTKSPTNVDFSIDSFTRFLKNLPEQDNNKFNHVVAGLREKSEDEVKVYVKKLFEVAMEMEDFSLMARLAQMIDIELRNKSFRFGLIESIETALNKEKFGKEKSKAMIFAAELFTIDWIQTEQLINCFDELLLDGIHTEIALTTVQKMLKIVAVKLISKHQSEKCKTYHQIVKGHMSRFEEINLRLMCLEVLDLFEGIERSENHFSSHKKLEKLLNSALESSQENQLPNFNDDNEANIYAKMLHNKLLECFRSEEAKEMLKILELIGLMYNQEFVSNDYFNEVFDDLFRNERKSPEISVDGIETLLTVAGPKMELNDKDKLDQFMKFFKTIVKTETKSYRSKVYNELLERRANDWITLKQDSKKQIAQNGEISFELHEDYQQLIKNPKSHSDQFIRNIWSNSESPAKQAKIFHKVFTAMENQNPQEGKNLQENLRKFLIRQNSYEAHEVLFIAELFKLEMISGDVLEMILNSKVVKSLPVHIINQIISTVSSNVNARQNVKIVAWLMKLEDIAKEMTNDDFTMIKNDLNELSDFIRELKDETKEV
jgi:hypothetical protein